MDAVELPRDNGAARNTHCGVDMEVRRDGRLVPMISRSEAQIRRRVSTVVCFIHQRRRSLLETMQILLASPKWHHLPIEETFAILASNIFGPLQAKLESFRRTQPIDLKMHHLGLLA